MNPVQIHAADEDLVTFVYKIPILGYYEDEAPTGFGGRISTSYKTDKNRSHLSYRLDDPAVTIDWDSKTKTFSYSVTVDRNEDGWVNTLTDFPDNRTGHGAQGITIPSGTDTFTFIQGDGYPDNPYCGSQAINIRLMLDKGTLYQNYITDHRNRGFHSTVANPTRDGYEFVGWRMTSGVAFDPDTDSGTLTSEPMTLYAIWRGPGGEILSSPEAPTASKDSGNYDESFDVELTAESGCEIYYTTDGSKPTTESPKYNGAITVTGTPGESTKTTIRAIAVKDGMSSEIAEYEYTLHIPSPSHNHSWNPAWSKDDEAHWHECDTPDCPITRDSEKNGYAAHTEDSGTVTTEPTTESEGVKTYKCTECGHIIRTEVIDKLTTTPTPVPTASPTPVPTASPTPPPSHVHNYGTEWKADDDNHWHECSCGSKSEEGVHTEDSGTVTIEPTVDAEGAKVYKCSVCGTIMRTEILEKLEPGQTYEDDDTDDDEDDDDSNGTKKSTQDKNSGGGGAPETGDTSHVGWARYDRDKKERIDSPAYCLGRKRLRLQKIYSHCPYFPVTRLLSQYRQAHCRRLEKAI